MTSPLAPLELQALDHRRETVAREMQAVFALAYRQEAATIGIALAPGAQGRSAEEIMASTDFHLGARASGELVGVLSVGADAEAGQIALGALVVHPRHQRCGIGRALVNEALERGRGLVFSVIASADNRAALALYATAGFVEYRRGQLGDAQWPMVKLRRPAA
jgi:ribosomal protein S18 acetylase RimI-like enzyme